MVKWEQLLKGKFTKLTKQITGKKLHMETFDLGLFNVETEYLE